MRKLNVSEVLNRFIKENKFRSYLEIGYSQGKTFQQIECERKNWIDPKPLNGSWDKEGFVQESDTFFEEVNPSVKFDLIFVDGLHHADQAYRDVLNSLKHLRDNGIIVMHDCSPECELWQKVPRESVSWNGDVWKALVKLFYSHSEIQVATYNSDHGLGLVRKGDRELPDLWFDLENLDWETLDHNRIEILNLFENFEELESYWDGSKTTTS